MSSITNPPAPAATPMSPYDEQVWAQLNEHWIHRGNRRGLPNWVNSAVERSSDVTRNVATRATDAVPDAVKESIRNMGDAIVDRTARPVLNSAVAILELFNDWTLELNNPEVVEKLARKRGLDIETFADLRQQELKVCDRLLGSNTLTWRSIGALEGAGMGALALVPVAGIPISIGADVLVIQVLSTAIAARIAYSYGYDAKDPAEQVFIQRLVRRSFMAQAAKAKPINDAAKAANAIKDRVRWSDKLRADHRLIAVLEKLMQQLGPAGTKVPVQNVAKVVPFVGVLIGAGMNSAVLGNVAADAQRYCQTRFLCEKYGLPLPTALTTDPIDDVATDA
jgi:hypothetical protein